MQLFDCIQYALIDNSLGNIWNNKIDDENCDIRIIKCEITKKNCEHIYN